MPALWDLRPRVYWYHKAVLRQMGRGRACLCKGFRQRKGPRPFRAATRHTPAARGPAGPAVPRAFLTLKSRAWPIFGRMRYLRLKLGRNPSRSSAFPMATRIHYLWPASRPRGRNVAPLKFRRTAKTYVDRRPHSASTRGILRKLTLDYYFQANAFPPSGASLDESGLPKCDFRSHGPKPGAHPAMCPREIAAPLSTGSFPHLAARERNSRKRAPHKPYSRAVLVPAVEMENPDIAKILLEAAGPNLQPKGHF